MGTATITSRRSDTESDSRNRLVFQVSECNFLLLFCVSMMRMTEMLPMIPPTMQRMYTQRLSRSSGLEDQGSAIDWGVSLPTGKIELSSERQARLGHNRTEKTLLQLCWRLHYSNYAEPQPTVSVRPCHGMLRLRY